MARTADAAGADALVVADAGRPLNPNAIRASTGAVFSLLVVEATLADVDDAAVAAAPVASTSYIHSDPPRRPLAIGAGTPGTAGLVQGC